VKAVNPNQLFLFKVLQHKLRELSVKMEDAAKSMEDEWKGNNLPFTTRFADL
jgi:hypothetical protein